ncbi:helix-turn-helix transcriptional regulator [Arsenophonus endosymbiont of Bemisia tabaci]|uniref:helix-turn-helix transcriptional regulator n=1 Tax=Arsenophonus endosymbiont of Bemisia tabaci TaxID=536059 RepID=UPI0015F780BE|nr:LuxR family transcriptional regulator [Arsenophonus endosymbiont of Bemisia tabaci]CAA2929475.1 Transcriptional activator protein EsaR [Arsenophonus endosymbiont of Bemisia tabaci Q2]
MSELFYGNDEIDNSVKNYLDRKFVVFGDFKYAYMILNKRDPMRMLIISNYPTEWIDIYKQRQYQQIDPVVLAAFSRITPFSWNERFSVKDLNGLRKIFNILKNYSITNGYTFVLHNCNNYLAILSILMNEDGAMDIIEEKLEKSKGDLQMLLLTIHEKITSLYREMIQQTYSMPADGKDFFSPRENEILYWASMGKTYQEIATILGIKLGTVKFHIGNVMKKLGVLNAKHAIRLGVELQLIKSVSK